MTDFISKFTAYLTEGPIFCLQNKLSGMCLYFYFQIFIRLHERKYDNSIILSEKEVHREMMTSLMQIKSAWLCMHLVLVYGNKKCSFIYVFYIYVPFFLWSLKLEINSG